MISFLHVWRLMCLLATFSTLIFHINVLARSLFDPNIGLFRADLWLGKKKPITFPSILLFKFTFIHDLLRQFPLDGVLREMETTATAATIFFRGYVFRHLFDWVRHRWCRVAPRSLIFRALHFFSSRLPNTYWTFRVVTLHLALQLFLICFFFDLFVHFLAKGTTVNSVPDFWSLVYKFETNVVC